MPRILQTLILSSVIAFINVSECAAHGWLNSIDGIISDKSLEALLALTISFLPILFIFYAVVNYFKVKKHYEEFPSVGRFIGFTVIDMGNLLAAILIADILVEVLDRRNHSNEYLMVFLVFYFGLNCWSNGLFLRAQGQSLKSFFLNKVNVLKILKLNVKYLTLLIPVTVMYITFLIAAPQKTRHALDSGSGWTLSGYLGGCYYDYEHCPIEKLVDKLDDRRENVRTIAKNMILSRKDPGTVEVLARLIEKKGAFPKKDLALYLLGELNDPEAIEPLIACMNNEDENESYRQDALWSLGKLPYTLRVAEAFSAQLDNKYQSIRFAAAGELVKHEDSRALTTLVHGLSGDSASRNQAMNELGNLRGKWAVGPLISMMRNPQSNREMIAEVLKNLCGVNLGSNYEKWENWRQENGYNNNSGSMAIVR